MSQQTLDALSNEDVQVRLDAVAHFDAIPPEARAAAFQKVTEDFNHEVRKKAAEKIDLCPSHYKRFLEDPDPHVRIAIVARSVEIAKSLGNQQDVLVELEKKILKDSVPEVRCALASVLHEHAKVATSEDQSAHEAVLSSKIVPLIDSLLKDQNDDVRVAASLNVKQLCIQFGFDFVFSQLYNPLHSMLTDTQWRVRNNAVELLFGLALVCTEEFFNNNLSQFLLHFLKDPCNQVRRFALSALPTLASHFGNEWLKTKLIRDLEKNLAQSSNFTHKQTYLRCISALVSFFPVQYQSNYVFQPMIRMLKDHVDNVVLLAIELLSQHREAIHPFRRQYELKPILESLLDNSQNSTIKERANAFLTECQ